MEMRITETNSANTILVNYIRSLSEQPRARGTATSIELGSPYYLWRYYWLSRYIDAGICPKNRYHSKVVHRHGWFF